MSTRASTRGRARLRERPGARPQPRRRRGRARARRRPPARTLLGALALALACACLPGAGAGATALSPSVYRTQRACEARQPGVASCGGIRLLARSLTSAQLHAAAVRQAGETAAGLAPAVTNRSPLGGGLTPANLHAAYALPGETLAGATQTIALVDAYNDPTAEADLGVYDSEFGLPACTSANGCFRKLNEQGKASPLPATQGEWATEISIDVQMAHAICENCHVLLVEAASASDVDLGKAVEAAAKAGATEISNSYGGGEESDDPALISYWNHTGLVVTASSGDCGYLSESCGGADASFPADSPDVVSVGGTHLTQSGGAWSSTAWEGAGSGCSAIFTAASWQSSLSEYAASGCDGKRSSSDVSAVADPWTPVDVYDSTPSGSGYPTGWGLWGGTSVASPIVASEWALAGGAHGVARPAATLYSNVGVESALYDVTSGHNGSCGEATACEAASGYDGPTGVGSPVGLDAFFPAAAPTDSAPPTISGTAEAGQTLSVEPGTWTGSPSTLAEQWETCNAAGTACTAVAGATKATYTLPASAVGATIRVQETASNASGAGAPAVSAASAPVLSNLPTISAITPTAAPTGSTVTITGTHLGSATAVHFGSLTARLKVDSATQIEATVPNGATSSTVRVLTPAKTVAAPHVFTPTLSIVSFAPQVAFAGKVVTVTGVGFDAGSVVSFGEVQAHTVYVSSSTLKATVPANAPTAAIKVTNTSAPLGTVASATSFALAK
ncbi:MAG TPA: IPT/TIG domain-containing protein [Solirubrobacteraceae bacterium]|nr:IPT/TIG domain-containing protein [Solirubrobacteraceae bacterium]